MSSGILVASETTEGTCELLTKGREIARQLNLEICAIKFGNKEGDGQVQSYFEHGAQKVLEVSRVDPLTMDAGTYAFALFEIARENGPDIILMNSTRLGKEAAGRTAQKLEAGCVTDGIGVDVSGSEIIVNRYALGGNTIASQIVKTKKKVISLMPRTFEARPAPVTGEVEMIDLKNLSRKVQLIERKQKAGEKVSIDSAENLVCVGQGIIKKEDLEMINELCTLLGAELGCTRAISSDFHWLSEDRMVGISGKRCKPKFHVSIGISGQIQHTVGIMNSKLIVAINNDKEAPIFRIADYGIVGDLYQVVPELVKRIKVHDR